MALNLFLRASFSALKAAHCEIDFTACISSPVHTRYYLVLVILPNYGYSFLKFSTVHLKLRFSMHFQKNFREKTLLTQFCPL